MSAPAAHPRGAGSHAPLHALVVVVVVVLPGGAVLAGVLGAAVAVPLVAAC